jgi:hypothetical protein
VLEYLGGGLPHGREPPEHHPVRSGGGSHGAEHRVLKAPLPPVLLTKDSRANKPRLVETTP